MKFIFGNTAEVLHTRHLGRQFREEIEKCLLSSEELILFDFMGVRTVTNSFADECFAKLLLNIELKEIQKRTTFKNVSPLIEKIILKAFKERALEAV
jgi:hypothetical protein